MSSNDNKKIVELITTKSKVIRKHIINMIGDAGRGHPGGSLSATEIVSSLYFQIMNIDSNNPAWEERDRFILSKGHASALLYAALAERGYFDVKELSTFRIPGSNLSGHPEKGKVPGIEMTTGSLGHGLSIACGIAIAGKYDSKDFNVYCLLGDGEIQEGQVWEAAMFAGHFKLDNLIVFLDRNGLQIDGSTEEVMTIEPVMDKWKSFGWNTIKIDGHDVSQILNATDKAKKIKEKPTIIIAKTIKGKGISFMENNVSWHGKAPDKNQKEMALAELNN